MPVLKVDLQEGFSGETVVLLLNGSEVYRGTPKTRTQIGFADTRSFDLPSPQATLEVSTPRSGASISTVLDLSRDLYAGVSLAPDGSIVIHPSSEPFGYV
ncbi:MAG: hypothetical protein IT166_02410 [Bryobacterales bacterium]|nr:hypothetical protein [Bryobacterales bacterium]